jgi:hypothetical protein
LRVGEAGLWPLPVHPAPQESQDIPNFFVSVKIFPRKFVLKVRFCCRTANEGPVRIQYKCLVPKYVFPEMKLLFPKQNYNVLSPSSYTHISVRDFVDTYI